MLSTLCFDSLEAWFVVLLLPSLACHIKLWTSRPLPSTSSSHASAPQVSLLLKYVTFWSLEPAVAHQSVPVSLWQRVMLRNQHQVA